MYEICSRALGYRLQVEGLTTVYLLNQPLSVFGDITVCSTSIYGLEDESCNAYLQGKCHQSYLGEKTMGVFFVDTNKNELYAI